MILQSEMDNPDIELTPGGGSNYSYGGGGSQVVTSSLAPKIMPRTIATVTRAPAPAPTPPRLQPAPTLTPAGNGNYFTSVPLTVASSPTPSSGSPAVVPAPTGVMGTNTSTSTSTSGTNAAPTSGSDNTTGGGGGSSVAASDQQKAILSAIGSLFNNSNVPTQQLAPDLSPLPTDSGAATTSPANRSRVVLFVVLALVVGAGWWMMRGHGH